MAKKIGIIEDDKKLATELCIFLKNNGYQAEIVEESEYVAEKILERNFHLLLLDIGLPQTDGLFLCREIRKQSELPMIMITSRNTEMMELMSISTGADDFVSKPFNTQILLARLERLLNRAYTERASDGVMKIGTLTFDSLRGIIYAKENGEKEKSVELTKNEIKILALLGRRVGGDCDERGNY